MKSAALSGGGAKAGSQEESVGAHHSAKRPRLQAPTINDLRFRRVVERVYRLGPRVVAELLVELDADPQLVERYAELDRFPRVTLHAVGADSFPPVPLHSVQR